MKIAFYPKLFVLFSLLFITCTVVGTLSHEGGHIAVAKYLGYGTELHYGSMNPTNSGKLKERWDLYNANKQAIKAGADFKDKAKFDQLTEDIERDGLWVSWGGPLHTMLTGSFGLLLLGWRSNKRKQNGFKPWDWLGVFLSLFWLRETANLMVGVFGYLFLGNPTVDGGDEGYLAHASHLPAGSFLVPFGVTGALVATYVVFWIIPKNVRLTFISGGLAGGVSGYVLWLYLLGPVVLP